MGWKTINGRRYYYRTTRVAGAVRTTYFGAGPLAELMAELVSEEQLERAMGREVDRTEREASDAGERLVADWFDGIQALADAAMIEAGFHKHRGQWRRKRGGRSDGDH